MEVAHVRGRVQLAKDIVHFRGRHLHRLALAYREVHLKDVASRNVGLDPAYRFLKLLLGKRYLHRFLGLQRAFSQGIPIAAVLAFFRQGNAIQLLGQPFQPNPRSVVRIFRQ